MEQNQGLTSKVAQERLLFAYRAGNAGSFMEFVKRPLFNPIEQRDEQNKRKLHPLLVIGVVLLVVAAGAAFLFHH